MADAVQETLLHLQEHDTTLDQLRHRRATLPERPQLAQREQELARIDAELEAVRGRRLDLERSQRRLEDEIAAVEAKAADADRTLYSGTVSAPRELQAIQGEVGSLKRRQSSLEDELLEVMELTDPVEEELQRVESDRSRVASEADTLRAAIAEAERTIDAETDAVAAAREEVASGVPASLLRTYDQLRGRLGGIAVARLEGNRCLGCRLTLPATEVDQIRRQPPDAVLRHEECGRILVR